MNRVFKKFNLERASLLFFLIIIVLDYIWIGARYSELHSNEGMLPLRFALSKNLLMYYLGPVAEALLSVSLIFYVGLFALIFWIVIKGPRVYTLSALIFSLLILQFRNVWILDGGDSFTIFFLYWVILFISVSEKNHSRIQYIFGLQLAFIYISNGFLKNGPSWTETGSALKIIWSQPYISYPWINSVVEGIDLKWLTLSALYLERTLPLLVVFRKYKWAAFFFIPYHIVIFLTVRIDFFALINVASWLLLLHPPVALQKREGSPKRDLIPMAIGILILSMGIGQFARTHIFKKPLPEKLVMLLSTLRLNQDWRMFTPDPRFTSYDYSFRCFVKGESKACPESLVELEKVENWGRRRKQFLIKLAEKKNALVLHESFHTHLCLRYKEFDSFDIAIKAKIKDLDQPDVIRQDVLEWPEHLKECHKRL